MILLDLDRLKKNRWKKAISDFQAHAKQMDIGDLNDINVDLFKKATRAFHYYLCTETSAFKLSKEFVV